MRHHHRKHDHDRTFLNDLTIDAGDRDAQMVRIRMGYQDQTAFFEEAPAGILMHEALTVLESACGARERRDHRGMGAQPWVNYEATREAYLTAALVFGRADLLATVLLDSTDLSDAWSRFFSAGKVHRTLPMDALNLLIDEAPTDVLNTLLVTDLTGDLYRVPVWVAMLLAARPAGVDYNDLLARLERAGVTGFREHLAGKHQEVLKDRMALNRAIQNVDGNVAPLEARKVHHTLGQPLDDAGVLRSMDEGLKNILAVIDGLGADRAQAARRQRTTENAAPTPMAERLNAWGATAYLTRDEEDRERKRLGLLPRVIRPVPAVQRTREAQLLQAVKERRMKDVRRLLDEGVDPDTPAFQQGIAFASALLQSDRLAGLMLARGASPIARYNGETLLSFVCRAGYERYTGGFIDREDMEDVLDTHVQAIGLLVRAGATAWQLNVKRAPGASAWSHGSEAEDAWHWIKKVPALYEAYLDAVEERRAIVDEAEKDLAGVRQAVGDYPDQVKQAEADVHDLLDEVKRKARGG